MVATLVDSHSPLIRLNPCFSGIVVVFKRALHLEKGDIVLILVLVE